MKSESYDLVILRVCPGLGVPLAPVPAKSFVHELPFEPYAVSIPAISGFAWIHPFEGARYLQLLTETVNKGIAGGIIRQDDPACTELLLHIRRIGGIIDVVREYEERNPAVTHRAHVQRYREALTCYREALRMLLAKDSLLHNH